MAAAVVLATLGFGGAAHAQSTAMEGRVDRLEREMRAVQRKVFPGGAGQTIEPQITPPQQPQVQPGAPASSPVADLTSRIVALEAQSSTLTGQVEQIQYRLRQMEDAFSAYKRSTDARLKALEDTNSAVGSDAPAPADAGPVSGGIGSTRPPAGPKPGKPAPKPAEPASNAAAGVERPSTGDAAEDAYLYGYRLWQATGCLAGIRGSNTHLSVLPSGADAQPPAEWAGTQIRCSHRFRPTQLRAAEPR